MIAFLLVAALAASDTVGAADTTRARRDTTTTRRDSVPTRVAFGAFVDGYYAWDTGRPRAFDRLYTTQPARHNEFNVNLAFVEAVLTGDRVRGRLALQAGTSVQSNYFAEPRVGAVSGGELSRNIQEATVGVRLGRGLWLDGGIYFSYIGFEGWISRDNPTYTRSLVADFTPYYLSGAKLTWQASRTISAQLHVMNGWQNVSETNADKAVGTRIDWTPRRDVVLAWGTFIGNEQPDSLAARTRILNQFLARWTPTDWELSAVLDLGRQSRPGNGADTWSGSTVIARRALTPTVKLVGRAEYLFDRGQVLVRTDSPGGFRTTGASLGLDVQPDARVLWRTEVRGFRSRDAIWPRAGAASGNRTSAVLVSSLALTL
ncbi:MAG: porin [Gemmatimonadaceae bacterium]|jgi:hypothetical protein|nr:porin [Gemmatimonadaceae bacterium]